MEGSGNHPSFPLMMVHDSQEIRSNVKYPSALDSRVLPQQGPGTITQGDGDGGIKEGRDLTVLPHRQGPPSMVRVRLLQSQPS
jgi:hypothetical protein